MNISRWLFSLLLLGLSASIAMADSVDPKFVPIGGTGSIVINSLADFSPLTFSYQQGVTQTVDCGQVSGSFSDAGFTCIKPFDPETETGTMTEFVNNTGQTWTSLTLEFVNVVDPSGVLVFSPTGNANFIDPYFNNSTFGINEASGNPFVTFFGIDANHPGILAAFGCDGDSCSGPIAEDGTRLYDFAILADVTDAEKVPGSAFTAQGSATVPEPPTVLLALGGGLLLFLFKRP